MDGVTAFLPGTMDEALAMKAAHPGAVPVAGGTDVMVDVNFGRLRPAAFLDLTRIGDFRDWHRDDGHLFLGAGVSFTRIIHELPEFVPLAQASRSVGSPQIRNRGTVGGNLGTASPAGDALPVLATYEAEVVLTSQDGVRTVALNDFLLGPKKTAIQSAELILGTRWRVVRGPGSFAKIGTRNAMVISVAGLALVLDEALGQVRVALGSVGPTVNRAREAEAFIGGALTEAEAWADPSRELGDAAIDRFCQMVAASAHPIDDVRGTAAYRVHAVAVLAGRALRWTLGERRLQKWL